MNKKETLNFIKKYHSFILSTINDNGFPESRAVINIANPEIAPHLTCFYEKNDKIYITTNTSSSKVKQIYDNPLSSVYMFDNDSFVGLLLIGEALEIKDEKTKRELWDDSWEMYYKGGFNGGDYTIIEFVPQYFKAYKNFSLEEGDIDWE